MSVDLKNNLKEVINDCFDAVNESKIGKIDPAQNNMASQAFLTILASVAPKYFYNEVCHVEPKEKWQTENEEEDEPNAGG